VTIQLPADEFVSDHGLTDADKLALHCHKFLQGFVLLEEKLTRLVCQKQCKFDPRSTFGNKVKAVGQIITDSTSKQKVSDRFSALEVELSVLSTIRNDLAHGNMTIVSRGAEKIAAFQNAADSAVQLPQYILMSAAEMEAKRSRLPQIANELKQLVS
jgi:hypothetical protein